MLFMTQTELLIGYNGLITLQIWCSNCCFVNIKCTQLYLNNNPRKQFSILSWLSCFLMTIIIWNLAHHNYQTTIISSDLSGASHSIESIRCCPNHMRSLYDQQGGGFHSICVFLCDSWFIVVRCGGRPMWLSVHQSVSYHLLTHWGRDKMAVVFQTTFSNAFSWMKMYEFPLRFHWSLFLRFELTIFQQWFG